MTVGSTPEVGIVGGGIGGLTAALALHRAGLRATVYESASTLAEIGAGIQISPNASLVLRHLGLVDRLDEVGVRPVCGDLRRWEDWSLLTSQPLGEQVEAQFGAPYYHVHRADLHGILAAAVPASDLRLGLRCVGFEELHDRVRIDFDAGESAWCDVLIGADGIHSSVRRELFGPETARFSGNAAWRGLVPVERIADLELPVASTAVLGPGKHFVYYFVSGGRFVNWVGIAPTQTWTSESWAEQDDLDNVIAGFTGWNEVVQRLILSVQDAPVYRWALYDRDPLPSWGVGRTTLLGDACHPMLPFMAQGAAQSIEDAAVLAGCLAGAADPVSALRTYEARRRDRTAKVQLAARANEVMFHLPDGPAQVERDVRLGAASGDGAQHRNAWLFDYDAIAVGTDAIAVGADAIAVGADAIARGTEAIARGADAIAVGTDAIARGTDTHIPKGEAP